MSTDEITRLLEEARPSAWILRREPREAERGRVEAVKRLREIWRGQIESFAHAEREEIARYRAAEKAARSKAGAGSAHVQFERAEIVRADHVSARLDEYFAQVGLGLLAAQNPKAAMAKFLGHAKRPGRPRRTDVTADVKLVLRYRDLRAGGMKAEDALRRLADGEMTGGERKRVETAMDHEDSAYERVRARLKRARKSRTVREALADREMTALEAGDTNPPG